MTIRKQNIRSETDDASTHDAGMFAAASFGAVLGAKAEVELPISAAQLPRRPVIAFYGFRGGSGRTTALTHVAATFAKRGKTVVAVDLDLEAPGLATVLDCPSIEPGTGSLALLRIAERVESATDERLRLAPHLVSPREGLPPIRVLPAGHLDAAYYADLDLLNPSLWHVMDGPSPLRLLLDRIRTESDPDFVFLDCRTGLAPLSAAAIFHEVDVVVVCLSATRQSHEGGIALVNALRAAQTRRGGLPSALLVPTMFVESDEGRRRRDDLVAVLDEARRSSGSEDPEDDPLSIVEEGIPFRTSVSVTDVLGGSYEQVAGGAYQPLIEALDGLLGVEKNTASTTAVAFDRRKVLEELAQEIAGLAFAEEVSAEDVTKYFLEPEALPQILSNATYYVVGAKGSGKSWLYKRMIAANPPLDAAQTFLRGHGPGDGPREDPDFKPEDFRALDKRFARQKGSYEASFWRLRAAATLMRAGALTRDQTRSVLTSIPAALRTHWVSLADPSTSMYDALVEALAAPDAQRISATMLPQIDNALLAARNGNRFTLAYDALDTGFGSSPTDLERRRRYVRGLVDALEGVRGTRHVLGFKVMLREDVFSELEVQNKSHLRTATVELVWRPIDVWKLALNVAVKSKEYKNLVHKLDPTIEPAHWPDDEDRLRRLLEPLWGAEMERGRKVYTATFVQRRTADGQDRLFPRTVVEMLKSAVAAERKRDANAEGRVLTSAALQDGYREASKLRLVDLKKEYEKLSRYLDALSGMQKPTATRRQLITTMQNKLRSKHTGSRSGARGPEPGTLHAGEGGWNKVVDRLLEIGVIREYKRATGAHGEAKYEIALLYRPALGIRLGVAI